MAGEHSPGTISGHKFEDHLELSPGRTADVGLMQVTGRTQSPAMVYAVALGHFFLHLSPNQDPDFALVPVAEGVWQGREPHCHLPG